MPTSFHFENEPKERAMIKTYKSRSVLSFSITMPKGNYRRIRFTPFSWGGGVYVTEDEEEQKVLESIPEYGNRFVLCEVASTESEDVKPAEETPVPGAAEESETETQEEVNTNNVVQVADYAEAKEYLIDNYGYKSGQLRSQKAIAEAAEKNGITFEYA